VATLLKTGWLLVHVPKTGGTWLRRGLAEAGFIVGEEAVPGVAAWPVPATASPAMRRLHATARGVGHDPARSFCFVRHPLAWYRSLWAHGVRDGWEPREFALDQYGCDDFRAFMDRCLRAFPVGFVSLLYRVFTDGAGFVGRHERLGEDLHAALAGLDPSGGVRPRAAERRQRLAGPRAPLPIPAGTGRTGRGGGGRGDHPVRVSGGAGRTDRAMNHLASLVERPGSPRALDRGRPGAVLPRAERDYRFRSWRR
jgi:hypothetical protein